MKHAIIEYGFQPANSIPIQDMMPFIFTLFNTPAYMIWPANAMGIAALVVMLLGLVFGNWYWRDHQREMQETEWFLFGILITLAPVAVLFLGIQLPHWGAIPLPNMSLEPTGGSLMILGALPALVAGWILGPISASII